MIDKLGDVILDMERRVNDIHSYFRNVQEKQIQLLIDIGLGKKNYIKFAEVFTGSGYVDLLLVRVRKEKIL